MCLSLLCLFGASIFTLKITEAVNESTRGELVWEKTFGGKGYDIANSIQITPEGDYIITGVTSPAPASTAGPSEEDIYLLKIDSSGELIWEKNLGGNGPDGGYSVQMTDDGCYIITGFMGSYEGNLYHIYLGKIDSSGNTLWEKTYFATGWDFGCSVIQTSDRGYAIAGNTYNYMTENNEVYLVKIDASGNEEWGKIYGGTDDDYGSCIVQTNDGGYAIAGTTESFGNGGDVYLVKTDNLGNMEWSKTYGDIGRDGGCSIVQTSDDGYAIAGLTYPVGKEAADVYLVKTDSSGNEEWSKTYGGEGWDEGNCVIQTNDENYVITGISKSFSKYGDCDAYVIKTDTEGNLLWELSVGGTRDDTGKSIRETENDSYVITGSTESSGAGEEDVYLIKIQEKVVTSDSGATEPVQQQETQTSTPQEGIPGFPLFSVIFGLTILIFLSLTTNIIISLRRN